MIIKSVKVGNLETNCYILSDETSREAVVIDPGGEAAKIMPLLDDLKVLYIILTHGHPDHFGALDLLKQKTGAKILMNPGDDWFIKPEQDLNEGDEVKFGQTILRVIATPGHSRGGICLYGEGRLFSGDTLFYDNSGRTDLIGSSEEEMRQSLHRLGQLPSDTLVYPGHGRFTTIGQEKDFGTLG